MGQDDVTADDVAWWAAMAVKLLHPVHLEIIEAMSWIDEPLTATDLVFVLEGKRVGLRLEHHLRRLARLDVVVFATDDDAHRPVTQRRYRLAEHFRPPEDDQAQA